MATIREWLNKAGFDWRTGRIIFQETYYCDTLERHDTPGWASPEGAREITADDPILDYEFDDGFGAPECPKFIAEDRDRFFFPAQYDGATWLEFVWKDINKYLDANNETPYPGG